MQLGLREDVDRYVPRQIVFENHAEQVGAHAGKPRLVDRQRAFDAAPEDERARAGQLARHRPRLHADETFDLPPVVGLVARQEQPQQIAQSLAAGAVIEFVERQVIEVQLANQPPGHLALRIRRLRHARRADQSDAFERRGFGHRQVAHAVARHEARQIAVRHQRIDRQVANFLAIRRLVLVDERHEHLRADIGRTRAVAARRFRHEPALAPCREISAMIVLVVVQRLVQRPELEFGGGGRDLPVHRLHRKHLVIERRQASRHQAELRLSRRQFDPVHVARKQVDHRRAEQREARCIDDVREPLRRLVEQHDDLDLLAGHAAQPRLESGQCEEVEPPWTGEIFMQQVVPVELRPRERQQALVCAEPFVDDRIDRDGRERLAGRGEFTGRTRNRRDAGCVQQLEEVRGDLVVARQIQRQPVQPLQIGHARVAGRTQPQAQRAAHLRAGRHIAVERGDVGRNARQPRLGDLQRIERHVLAAAELAGGLLAGRHACGKGGAARDAKPVREIAFRAARVKARDRHRRRGRHVVRIKHFQQPAREARELRVELDLHARGHEAERLDQPFDVRIGHFARLHAKAPRDLRVRLRELGGELAHVDQFLVVVVEQSRVHCAFPFVGPRVSSRACR
ncbi:Uncharacterised protein [Burkholderia oklahomensis]|nr:Uncharacterised protein [Burkholderia oklahomensis]